MINKYLQLFLLCSVFSSASNVDCSSLRSTRMHKGECNPYSAKLIKVVKTEYKKDTHDVIAQKTLPLPIKLAPMSHRSFEDILKNHVRIEDSLRFKASSPIVKEKVEEKLEEKVIESYGYYRVVDGDILGKITEKFGLKVSELIYFNHLVDASKIKIGQKLKLPFDQDIIDNISSAKYTIKSNDTLIGIAKKFNIKPKLLVKFNHIRSTATIRKGRVLKLPLPYVLKKIEAEREFQRLKRKKLLLKQEHKKRKFLRRKGRHRLRVTATAYSSHRGQTDKTPFLAAWNNKLKPGMKIIAVSRDLLTRYHMKNGTKVWIGGLKGFYRVRDKMNKRFKKRIDIYMGINRRRALQWGRKSVMIAW